MASLSGKPVFATAQEPIVIGRFGNAAVGSSEPHDFAATGDLVFFAAETNATGQEVWRSDGTSAGTYMLADTRRGSDHFFPAVFTRAGDLMFWRNNDDALWVSDGTVAGTEELMKFTSGPNSMTAAGDLLFFTVLQREGRIWRSDGTKAGTFPVDNVPQSTAGIRAVGASVFFGSDSAHGLELWKADAAEATLVAPLPYGTDPYIDEIVAVGGSMFFVVNRDFSGNPQQDVWFSDGTAAGTRLVVEGLYNIYETLVLGDRLYFGANDGTAGIEPWVSDGTGAGTYMLRDVNPGPASSVVNDQYLRAFDAFDDRVVFIADDGSHGRELWITDATEDGTLLLSDIVEGPDSSSPLLIGSVGEVYVFRARDHLRGIELWRSDGTAAGTEPIRDIVGGPGDSIGNFATVIDRQVFFFVVGPATVTGLWRSDGTEAGTVFLARIEPGETDTLFHPRRFTSLGNKLFLGAGDAEGIEPWVSDGTPSGTYQIVNIAADERPAEPNRLVRVYDRLYFSAETPSDRFRLWRSDGTEPGTESLDLLGSEILPTRAGVFFSGHKNSSRTEPCVIDGPRDQPRALSSSLRGSTPEEFAFADGQVFFAANGIPPDLELRVIDGTYALLGRELWVTRGTAESTSLVESENGGAVLDPMDITALNDKVVFRDPETLELWLSDGTPAGTRPIVAVDTVTAKAILTAVAGSVYFMGDSPATGIELWATDGTAEGTRLVSDTRIGGLDPTVEGFGVLDEKLLYCVGTVLNRQLWVSDGTDAGTIQLTQAPGKGLFTCSDFVRFGDRLLFLSEGSLWRTDGTVSRTGIIHSAVTSPGSLAVLGPHAYFSACNGLGCELWQTDGTSAGTRLAFDVLPGIASSAPGSLTAVDATLFFVAYEDFTSRRLWAMRDTSMQPPCPADCDGDRSVTVDEVVVLTHVALGNSSLFACVSGDQTDDGDVTVDELLGAIGRVLNGCDAAL